MNELFRAEHAVTFFKDRQEKRKGNDKRDEKKKPTFLICQQKFNMQFQLF